MVNLVIKGWINRLIRKLVIKRAYQDIQVNQVNKIIC